MSDAPSAVLDASSISIPIPTTALAILVQTAYQNASRAVAENTELLRNINRSLAPVVATGSPTEKEVSAAIMQVTEHCIKRLEAASLAMKIE